MISPDTPDSSKAPRRCAVVGCTHRAPVSYAVGPCGSYPSVDAVYMWLNAIEFGEPLCHCHAMGKHSTALGNPCTACAA